jgi:hypothetical protein
MSTTCTYHICGEVDSWKHSLVQCKMARSVWVLSDSSLLEYMEESTEPDAKRWLFGLMDVLSHDEFTRLVVTLWAI